MKAVGIPALLLPAINQQIAYRKACKKTDTWCAPWKHFQTWINNQCWPEEQPQIKINQLVGSVCQYCGDRAVAAYGRNWHCGRAACRAKAKD